MAVGQSLFSIHQASRHSSKALLILPDGRRFDLIETARMIFGVIYQPLDDPDMYRALVDAAQVAT
jgi:hypothetical protein